MDPRQRRRRFHYGYDRTGRYEHDPLYNHGRRFRAEWEFLKLFALSFGDWERRLVNNAEAIFTWMRGADWMRVIMKWLAEMVRTKDRVSITKFKPISDAIEVCKNNKSCSHISSFLEELSKRLPGSQHGIGKGSIGYEQVQGVAGDDDLRITSIDAEHGASLEQRLRQSLTNLPLASILGINEQNRPLPGQLRQSRTIYHGGVQSGFNDPLTNPFSRFVWHAKDDRYYVQPVDSVNSFRRQNARQKMINLAAKEQIWYPEASELLSRKQELDYPEQNSNVKGNELEHLWRPSYFIPQSGHTGIANSHYRYRSLPSQPERLYQHDEELKDHVDARTPEKFDNRIENYVNANESIDLQDAAKVVPFQSQRYLQGRPQVQ